MGRRERADGVAKDLRQGVYWSLLNIPVERPTLVASRGSDKSQTAPRGARPILPKRAGAPGAEPGHGEGTNGPLSPAYGWHTLMDIAPMCPHRHGTRVRLAPSPKFQRPQVVSPDWCNSAGAVNECGHRVILASLESETDDTENTTMADDSMSLLETLRKVSAEGEVDVLREGVRLLAQAIMEAEVTELTGVAKGERDPERRLTHRNGYRERCWDTRVGTIELDVPRVRDGSYLPSLLDPRLKKRCSPRKRLSAVPAAYCSRSPPIQLSTCAWWISARSVGSPRSSIQVANWRHAVPQVRIVFALRLSLFIERKKLPISSPRSPGVTTTRGLC